jgi:hypothetical protein
MQSRFSEQCMAFCISSISHKAYSGHQPSIIAREPSEHTGRITDFIARASCELKPNIAPLQFGLSYSVRGTSKYASIPGWVQLPYKQEYAHGLRMTLTFGCPRQS